jgi:hypothetical protein
MRWRNPCLAALLLIIAFSLRSIAAGAGTLEQLKSRFNEDKAVPRLIVLVSPTCPACVGGAEWIQDNILADFPNLKIRVYAIWYEMYPGDSPKAFPSAQKTMPDHRVEHYWDKKKETGRWFKRNVPTDYKKAIMWDAYYLYDAGAQWDATPQPLVSHGRTLLETRKELLKQIFLLSEKQK